MNAWLELCRTLGIPEDVARAMYEGEFVIASGRVVLLAPAEATTTE